MTSYKWPLGFADPTLAGWFTVALYLIASLSCWKSARETELGGTRHLKEFYLWRSIAILFLTLGVNKLLNLITVLTVLGRSVAHLQGWYDRRQPVQMVLIGLLATSCVVVVTMLLIWARRAPIPTRLALISATMTLTFVLVRAISYHDVDRFLFERILGLQWNLVIEIGGISLVLLATHWRRVIHTKSASASHVR
jgi:hypothetical protein